MKCEKCGAEIIDNSRFCYACGADLTAAKQDAAEEADVRYCPFCGASNDADARYCEECGKDMDSVFEKESDQEKSAELPTSEENEPVLQDEQVSELVTEDIEQEGYGLEEISEAAPEDLPGKESDQVSKSTDLSEDINRESLQAGVVYCPYCGAENESGAVFCASCGKNMSMADDETEVTNTPSHSKTGGKKGKKGLIIAIAVIAAAACIGVIYFGLKGVFSLSKKKEPQTIAYVQDNDIYMLDLGSAKKESIALPGDAKRDANNIRSKSVTPDGRYLCYLTSYDESDDSYTAYMKKIGSKEDAVKIASAVRKLKLLDDGTVIYQDDQVLYKTNYKGEKEKIGSNAEEWDVTENQKYVVWLGEYDEDIEGYDGLYYSDIALKVGKQKLASAVQGMFKMTENGGRIYFKDDGGLYVIKDLQDKEKIASEVSSSIYLDTDGSVYYMKPNDDILLADLVEDDYESEDAGVTYPREEDYQHEVVKSSYWSGTYTDMETDYDAYNKALDRYAEVEKRNQIRDILNNAEASANFLLQYCRYSDKGETVLDPNVIYQYDWDQESKGIGYPSYSEDTVIRMSDIFDEVYEKGYSTVYFSTVADIIRKIITQEGTYKYCDENGVFPLSENLRYVFCDNEGKTGYGILISDDYTKEDLYTFPVTGKDAGVCSLYAEDVYIGDSVSIRYMVKEENGDLYYFADSNEWSSCDLYLNKNMIATDVIGSFSYYNDVKDGVCYYATDYKDGQYSLWKFEGGKSVKIADDVYMHFVFNSRSIVVLTDYNTNRMKGTLEFYNGKDTDTIADDVQTFT